MTLTTEIKATPINHYEGVYSNDNGTVTVTHVVAKGFDFQVKLTGPEDCQGVDYAGHASFSTSTKAKSDEHEEAIEFGKDSITIMLDVGLIGMACQRVVDVTFGKMNSKSDQTDESEMAVEIKAKRVQGDKKSSQKSYKKFLNEGRKLTTKGKYQEAIAAYQQALIHDPNNSLVLGELGFTAQKMKQYKLAEKMALLCIRQSNVNKVKGSCYYNLGRALESQDNKVAAAQAYTDSLRVRPENKAVKKQLDQLGVKVKAVETPACLDGECKIFEWIQLCPELIKESAQFIALENENSATCTAIASRKVKEDLLKKVSLFKVDGGQGEEVIFVTFEVEAGWLIAGVVGYAFNPGVNGITEDFSFKTTLRDVIGNDKASELIVYFKVDRTDVDFGVGEEESSSIELEHICSLDSNGTRARCYGPIVREYHYDRYQIDELDQGKKSKSPSKKSYKAVVGYPQANQVKVVRIEGEFDGTQNVMGTHKLSDLPTLIPQAKINIYTR